MMFVAVVPTFLELAIPMATVVGVMLAVARLSSDAELIVMRASGVSLYQILPAIVAFGTSLALIGIFVAHTLKPWGYHTVSDLLFKIAQDRTTAGLEPGVFNKLGTITLYPEQIDYRTGELTRVLLDQQQPGSGRRIFFAERGHMLSDPSTHSLTLELNDGEIHEQTTAVTTAPSVADTSSEAGRNYSVTRFSANSIDIGPEMLDSRDRDDETPVRALSSAELQENLRWYEDAVATISGFGVNGIPLAGQYRSLYGEKTNKELSKRIVRINTELVLRWSAPFSALVLALVAFPLGVQPPRSQNSWGPGASLGIGIGIFLLYYGLLSMGFALAENRSIPSVVAVWVPNCVAALCGLILNRAVCSERVHSAGELISGSFGALTRRPRR